MIRETPRNKISFAIHDDWPASYNPIAYKNLLECVDSLYEMANAEVSTNQEAHRLALLRAESKDSQELAMCIVGIIIAISKHSFRRDISNLKNSNSIATKICLRILEDIDAGMWSDVNPV